MSFASRKLSRILNEDKKHYSQYGFQAISYTSRLLSYLLDDEDRDLESQKLLFSEFVEAAGNNLPTASALSTMIRVYQTPSINAGLKADHLEDMKKIIARADPRNLAHCFEQQDLDANETEEILTPYVLTKLQEKLENNVSGESFDIINDTLFRRVAQGSVRDKLKEIHKNVIRALCKADPETAKEKLFGMFTPGHKPAPSSIISYRQTAHEREYLEDLARTFLVPFAGENADAKGKLLLFTEKAGLNIPELKEAFRDSALAYAKPHTQAIEISKRVLAHTHREIAAIKQRLNALERESRKAERILAQKEQPLSLEGLQDAFLKSVANDQGKKEGNADDKITTKLSLGDIKI